jgi:hypothetical protein
MKLILLFTCVAGNILVTGPQLRPYQDIVPLVSTRADVERKLGKPNFEYGLYDSENERVHITYSAAPCSGGYRGGYRVPSDTVIRIDVAPKKNLHLSDLRLDLGSYKKTIDSNSSRTFYRNDEEGVRVDVFEGTGDDYEKVLGISHGPTAKAISEFECVPRAKEPQVPLPSTVVADGDCPSGHIDVDEGNCANSQCKLKAFVSGWSPAIKPIFKWTVSDGSIRSGQGTWSITINTRRVTSKVITVTLRVTGKGLPKVCEIEEQYELRTRVR